MIQERYIKSAVIGFYLSGATMEEMCGVTGIDANVIKIIIDEYKKEINEKTTSYLYYG